MLTIVAIYSVHYVLGLWDRLIHSIPYLKSDKPHNLQAFTPQIVEAYLKVRQHVFRFPFLPIAFLSPSIAFRLCLSLSLQCTRLILGCSHGSVLWKWCYKISSMTHCWIDQ